MPEHHASSVAVRRGQYTLTLKGRVQEVGFRGYVEDMCRRLGIAGIIYNLGTDGVRVLCEGAAKTIARFHKEVQQYRLAEISDARIDEGIQLPYPPHRAVSGLEEEIYGRLDVGVLLLKDIKGDTGSMREDLKTLPRIEVGVSRVEKGLSRVEDVLREISGKL